MVQFLDCHMRAFSLVLARAKFPALGRIEYQILAPQCRFHLLCRVFVRLDGVCRARSDP